MVLELYSLPVTIPRAFNLSCSSVPFSCPLFFGSFSLSLLLSSHIYHNENHPSVCYSLVGLIEWAISFVSFPGGVLLGTFHLPAAFRLGSSQPCCRFGTLTWPPSVSPFGCFSTDSLFPGCCASALALPLLVSFFPHSDRCPEKGVREDKCPYFTFVFDRLMLWSWKSFWLRFFLLFSSVSESFSWCLPSNMVYFS